jgi:hypothetical protein
MTLSLNTIITFALSLYVIWMAWSENQREKASEKTLTAQQLKTFNDSYSMSRPDHRLPKRAATARQDRPSRAHPQSRGGRHPGRRPFRLHLHRPLIQRSPP